jgi:hypothetical protein
MMPRRRRVVLVRRAPVECAGPAGSVILFDSNGIHRGNRNLGPRREVVFGVYSAGRHLEGCRFDVGHLYDLADWQKAILVRSRTANIPTAWGQVDV